MKEVRFITKEEYVENVLPLVKEIKTFFRKKFLINTSFFNGIYTYNEFIIKYIDYNMNVRGDEYNFGEDYYREKAIKRLDREGIKKDVPQEVIDRKNEIMGIFGEIFSIKNDGEILRMTKDNKIEVRNAINYDIYIDDIKNNKVNFDTIQRVCDSLGIKLPKRVLSLKAKQESGHYTKMFRKSNEEFLKVINDLLEPYKEQLRKIYIDSVMSSIKKFEESGLSFRDYVRINGEDVFISPYIGSNNFDDLLDKKSNEYSNDYITKFILRLEEKLSDINIERGFPKITFDSHNFNSNEFQSEFTLTYDDGFVLTGYSNVIIAGGYIQKLHQRYIFNFFQDGKKVNINKK